jgi:hypothetical protein
MMLGSGDQIEESPPCPQIKLPVTTMGIDIGKNAFQFVGLDRCGAIVLRQRWSRGQVEARLPNLPPCLVGIEAVLVPIT